MSQEFKFYFGAADGSTRKALRQLEEPNVMINYATKLNQPWNGIDNLFIDSGGYSFMLGKGEYETTDRKYLEFIEEHQPELFALRDYPCEPEVLEKNGRTVRDHLEATTERHRNLLSILPEYDIEGQPVSVIQGWKLNHYLEHLEMLKQQDLLTDYVAIGSICRRNQDQEIRRIILEIRERIRDRKLHAFGVKTNALRFPDVVKALDSADSQAYGYGYGQYKSSDFDAEAKRTWKDMALSYLQFKKKVENQIRDSGSGPVQQKLEVVHQ